MWFFVLKRNDPSYALMKLEAVLLETIGAVLVFSPLGIEVSLWEGPELWISYRHLFFLGALS